MPQSDIVISLSGGDVTVRLGFHIQLKMSLSGFYLYHRQFVLLLSGKAVTVSYT